jgi:hypothetical protein
MNKDNKQFNVTVQRNKFRFINIQIYSAKDIPLSVTFLSRFWMCDAFSSLQRQRQQRRRFSSAFSRVTATFNTATIGCLQVQIHVERLAKALRLVCAM